MPVPLKPLGDFLIEDREVVTVEPAATYQTAGMYSFGRGMFWRPDVDGASTSYRQYVRVKHDDFIFSKLFAWEGALGVVEERFDGALVSAEFPSFRVDNSSLDPAYLAYVIRRPEFYRSLAVNGMGDRRQRVNVGSMLSAKLPWPSMPEQKRIADWLRGTQELVSELDAGRVRADVLSGNLIAKLLDKCWEAGAGVPLRRYFDVVRQPIDISPEEQYAPVGVRSFGAGLIRYNRRLGRDLSKMRYSRVPGYALVVSNIKAWEGAVALTEPTDTDRVMSNRFIPLVPKSSKSVDLDYMKSILLSSRGLELLGAASPGSADRNRTTSVQGLLDISVPDLSWPEQVKIGSIARKIANCQQRRNVKMAASVLPAALNQVFGSMS